jgi:hypothetical protein
MMTRSRAPAARGQQKTLNIVFHACRLTPGPTLRTLLTNKNFMINLLPGVTAVAAEVGSGDR